MTDKELKNMIKNAYALPTTESEKRFVRSYEKRYLQIKDVLKSEFKYMGFKSILSGVILCLIFITVMKMDNSDKMWVISAMIPFCAVIPMVLISRSERYGMDEIEASCRFSLRFLRFVRMFIIGIFTIGLLLSIGIIMKVLSAFTIIEYIACVLTPYLISDLGAMIVTRRWHGNENVYGIFAVCIASSLVPFIVKMLRLHDTAIVAIAAVIFIAVIRECVKYVKESENISWNLC